MTTPLTEIELVNIALDYIGESSISSITSPQNEKEKMCARHFALEQADVLRSHPWNFAKRRANISRSGTPAFDFPDSYTLPADCVRVLSIEGDTELEYKKDYDIEGREMLYDGSGAGTIKLRYIALVTDLTQWDAKAQKLFAVQLAYAMAYGFSKSNTTKEVLAKELSIALREAITSDAMERPPQKIEISRVVEARRNLRGTGVADQFTRFT